MLRFRQWIGWVFFSTLMIFLYSSGFRGPYVFDDYVNIVDNTALHLSISDFSIENLKKAIFSLKSGPFFRPFSYLTFVVNYSIGELNPFGYKFFNVCIHIANAFLLYCFLNLIFNFYLSCKNSSDISVEIKSKCISLAAVLLWAFHPLHVSSVLYVVQRMNLLAFFFSMCVLYGYTKLRIKQINGINVYPFYFILLMCSMFHVNR